MENKEVAVVEEEATEEKVGFFKKAKDGVKKVWQSKPAKVTRKVLTGVGAIATACFVAGVIKGSGNSEEVEPQTETSDTEEVQITEF